MKRRLIGWNPVGEHLGSEPIYAMDSAPPHRRALDEDDEIDPYLRGGDADPDEAELADALDAAEAALRDVRAGRLSDDRAGIALARADIALSRRALAGGQDSAVGETTAGSVLDLERRGDTSRGTSRDVSYPAGRTAARSAFTLEDDGRPDHRRDFDSDAESAEDSMVAGLAAAGRTVRAPARSRYSPIDGPLHAIDAAAWRSLAQRIDAYQRSAFDLDRACGLTS